MATLQQIRDKADTKLGRLIELVESNKITDGSYKYYAPTVDVEVTIFVNTTTDKFGNSGYYICVTGDVNGTLWQKIVRQHADADDSRDWFKLLVY